LSKRLNASLNSAICSSVSWSAMGEGGEGCGEGTRRGRRRGRGVAGVTPLVGPLCADGERWPVRGPGFIGSGCRRGEGGGFQVPTVVFVSGSPPFSLV
jgi:hypothetical protein